MKKIKQIKSKGITYSTHHFIDKNAERCALLESKVMELVKTVNDLIDKNTELKKRLNSKLKSNSNSCEI